LSLRSHSPTAATVPFGLAGARRLRFHCERPIEIPTTSQHPHRRSRLERLSARRSESGCRSRQDKKFSALLSPRHAKPTDAIVPPLGVMRHHGKMNSHRLDMFFNHNSIMSTSDKVRA